MKSPYDVVGPVLVFSGVIAIIAFFAWRKRQASWKGAVLETVHVPGDDEGTPERCYVVCQTDAGKRIKIEVVGRAMLDGYKAGQQVEKKAGQSWPTVVS